MSSDAVIAADAPTTSARRDDTVTDAVLAVERYYGYPVDVEWVLDKDRRAGEPACTVQARPVTLTSEDTDPVPATWDPIQIAMKYVFKR